jgi:hypothetical protein
MTCRHCGAELPARAMFCGSCGRSTAVPSSGARPGAVPGAGPADETAAGRDGSAPPRSSGTASFTVRTGDTVRFERGVLTSGAAPAPAAPDDGGGTPRLPPIESLIEPALRERVVPEFASDDAPEDAAGASAARTRAASSGGASPAIEITREPAGDDVDAEPDPDLADDPVDGGAAHGGSPRQTGAGAAEGGVGPGAVRPAEVFAPRPDVEGSPFAPRPVREADGALADPARADAARPDAARRPAASSGSDADAPHARTGASAAPGAAPAADEGGPVPPIVPVPAIPPSAPRPGSAPSGARPIEDLEATRAVLPPGGPERYVLQFSTGESVAVTGTGLVGRNPVAEPSEYVDHLVALFDAGKSVSKTHLEFGQERGRFWVSDRFSTNGTIIRAVGDEPVRARPGRRYLVARGTRVDVGDQFFVVS